MWGKMSFIEYMCNDVECKNSGKYRYINVENE